MVKRLLVMAIMAALAHTMWAQKKVEATLGTDFVTTYIWRGQKCANPSFQPFAGLSWRGLSLDLWGSFAISPTDAHKGSQQEIDITLSYKWKKWHVGVTDYYFPEEGYSFFAYGGNGNSGHTFEGNLGYDFGFLSVDWYTNFAGNDGRTAAGSRAYTSYLLLQAPFHLARLDWNASVGVVPYSSTFYNQDHSTSFHCNHISLRGEYAIPCGKTFKLPVYAQATANPSNGNFYFFAGITIKAL